MTLEELLADIHRVAWDYGPDFGPQALEDTIRRLCLEACYLQREADKVFIEPNDDADFIAKTPLAIPLETK